MMVALSATLCPLLGDNLHKGLCLLATIVVRWVIIPNYFLLRPCENMSDNSHVRINPEGFFKMI